MRGLAAPFALKRAFFFVSWRPIPNVHRPWSYGRAAVTGHFLWCSCATNHGNQNALSVFRVESLKGAAEQALV